MSRTARLTRIGIWLCIVMAGVLSLQLMGIAAIDRRAGPPIMEARARWAAHGFEAYHLVVRIEALGQVCFQRLEIRGEWVRRTLENSCGALLIDELTINELFDLSDEIGNIPASRCVPSERQCPCQRVFTLRHIEYDAELGFPLTVLARSEVRPNLTAPDFWQALSDEGELPSCPAAPRRFTVQVLSLTQVTQ